MNISTQPVPLALDTSAMRHFAQAGRLLKAKKF
jgi:hypothetical protein